MKLEKNSYFSHNPVAEWKLQDAFTLFAEANPQLSQQEIEALLKSELEEIASRSTKQSRISKAKELLNTFPTATFGQTSNSVVVTNSTVNSITQTNISRYMHKAVQTIM